MPFVAAIRIRIYHPLGVEQSWQGDFLSLAAQFSIVVLYRGGKPQRGRRIVLKIDHITTTTPITDP
jgi:hypothetical protein